jgi:transposase
VVDALGNPVRILLTPGQASDIGQGEALLSGLRFEVVIADKAYDSNEFVAKIEDRGAQAVIPPRSNQKDPRNFDRHLYKVRNLVERFLNLVKHCRRIATRYEKLARNYLSFWQLGATMVLLK